MNRYTYALNAPVNFTDPMGLAAVGSVGGTARGVSSASTGGNGWLGWLQGGLDVVGATAEYVLHGPGTAIGTLADVASAGISWWQGDNLAASASLGAALPYVGSVALIAKASRQVDGVVGAAKEAGIVANGARGRAAEARVLDELGLTKNTRAVSTAEGRAVPDAMTDALSVEIKDAASVSRTRQVRIQTEAARNSGRESVLITGQKTCVSGPCAASFDRIIRRSDLGPQ